MMRSCWVVVFLLATAGAVCLAQSEAPSLGDLAKQQRSGKKATIVVTDDDVVNVPASAFDAAPSSTSGAPSVPGNSSGSAPDASSAKGSSSDAGTPAKGSAPVSELKSKLDRLKAEQEGWKRSAKHYEGLLASEPSEFRRQMYQDALDNDRKNVALYGAEIDRVQTQLSNAKQTSPSDSGQSGEAPASGNSKQL